MTLSSTSMSSTSRRPDAHRRSVIAGGPTAHAGLNDQRPSVNAQVMPLRRASPKHDISSWALRVSNPRPSPCKGEEDPQVRSLSRANACHRSAFLYLGVLPSCYARCYAEPLTEGETRASKSSISTTRALAPIPSHSRRASCSEARPSSASPSARRQRPSPCKAPARSG